MSFSSFTFSYYDFDLVDFYSLGSIQLSSDFIFICHCVWSPGLLPVGAHCGAQQDVCCPEMFNVEDSSS